MSKALKLLNNSSSTEARAERYIGRITTHFTNDLDRRKEKIEVMKDQVAELERMDLQTDVNSGRNEMTKEQIQQRFQGIFDLKVDIELAERELDVRIKAFAEYFGNSEIGSDEFKS